MTARTLYHAAKKAGIVLTVHGENIKFSAPAGAMTPGIAAEIKRIKPELNALLSGWYLDAAKALIIRETVKGPERNDLAMQFDIRVFVCTDSGQTFDDAYRVAYIELARSIEGVDVRREGVAA